MLNALKLNAIATLKTDYEESIECIIYTSNLTITQQFCDRYHNGGRDIHIPPYQVLHVYIPNEITENIINRTLMDKEKNKIAYFRVTTNRILHVHIQNEITENLINRRLTDEEKNIIAYFRVTANDEAIVGIERNDQIIKPKIPILSNSDETNK